MAKFIRVTMPNGEIWDVPAENIIVHRANYYAQLESKGDTTIFDKVYEEEYKNAMSDNDLIIQWAREKFKWDDVELYAFKSAPPPLGLSRKEKQEAWMNGKMEVVSRL